MNFFGRTVLGVLAFCGIANASVILLPVTDGDISDDGVLGYTVNTTNTSITTSSSGRDHRGIYEFDLSSIPSGSKITGASLNLTLAGTLSNVGGAPAVVTFYGYTADGVITETDFALVSSALGSDTYATDATRPAIGTTLTISLTDLTSMQSASDSAGRLFGIVSDVPNFVSFRVNSTDAAVADTLKPWLEVTYAPEPSRMILLGVGGMALIGRRRRQSRIG